MNKALVAASSMVGCAAILMGGYSALGALQALWMGISFPMMWWTLVSSVLIVLWGASLVADSRIVAWVEYRTDWGCRRAWWTTNLARLAVVATALAPTTLLAH